MRILFFDAPGGLLGLLRGHSFAKIKRYNLVAIDIHALQRFADDVLDILACDGKVAVDKANIVPFTHAHTANLYRTYSGCDLCRLDAAGSLSHGLAIGGKVGIKIKAE